MTTGTGNCRACAFRENTIFGCLEGETLGLLDGDKIVRTYHRGQVIFCEGGLPSAVYCIRSGQVKLFSIGSRAEQQVLRLAGPGETLGYSALLSNKAHEASAEALDRSEICVIPKQTLLSLLHQSPNLAAALLTKLALELREVEGRLIAMSQDSVRQRTANLLLMFLGDDGNCQGRASSIRKPVRRKEMAQMIGTTPETFSRVLAHFSRCGILAVSRKEIHVRDHWALLRMAEQPH